MYLQTISNSCKNMQVVSRKYREVTPPLYVYLSFAPMQKKMQTNIGVQSTAQKRNIFQTFIKLTYNSSMLSTIINFIVYIVKRCQSRKFIANCIIIRLIDSLQGRKIPLGVIWVHLGSKITRIFFLSNVLHTTNSLIARPLS